MDLFDVSDSDDSSDNDDLFSLEMRKRKSNFPTSESKKRLELVKESTFFEESEDEESQQQGSNECACKILKKKLKEQYKIQCDHEPVDNLLSDDSQILYIAIKYNSISLLESMLLRGVSVNYQDYKGQTSLHYAVSHNNKKMIRILMVKGADPNRCDKLRLSPLHLANYQRDHTIVQLIHSCTKLKVEIEKRRVLLINLITRKLKEMTNNNMVFNENEYSEIVKRQMFELAEELKKKLNEARYNKQIDDFCSRLSSLNTSDEVEDNINMLVDNLKNVNIAE